MHGYILFSTFPLIVFAFWLFSKNLKKLKVPCIKMGILKPSSDQIFVTGSSKQINQKKGSRNIEKAIVFAALVISRMCCTIYIIYIIILSIFYNKTELAKLFICTVKLCCHATMTTW